MDDFLIPRSQKFLITPDDSLDALRYLLPSPTKEDIATFRENARRAKALATERNLLTVGHYGMVGDLVCWLCGIQELIMLTMDNPYFVQQLLTIIENWNRRRMKLMLEEGVDLFARRAWYENADFWSPSQYRRFIFPSLRRDAEMAHQAGAKFGYLMSCTSMPLVEMMIDAGVDVLIGIDPAQDRTSAARAALEAGVDELIVCDTHHGGENIILDNMFSDPAIIYYNRSVGFDTPSATQPKSPTQPKAYQNGERRWMPRLDDTVDGLMLMGHHAKAGTEGAFLHHTWTNEWADFRINGQSVGEMGIEACYAGHWDIPPIMMQGDEVACREAEQQFPGIVTAGVKRSKSYDLCSGLDPESARQLTAQKVAEAIEKAGTGQIKPYKPNLPMTVTIQMKKAETAEAAAQKPGVQRIDEYTVAGHVKQQCDVVKWILGVGLGMRET